MLIQISHNIGDPNVVEKHIDFKNVTLEDVKQRQIIRMWPCICCKVGGSFYGIQMPKNIFSYF